MKLIYTDSRDISVHIWYRKSCSFLLMSWNQRNFGLYVAHHFFFYKKASWKEKKKGFWVWFLVIILKFWSLLWRWHGIGQWYFEVLHFINLFWHGKSPNSNPFLAVKKLKNSLIKGWLSQYAFKWWNWDVLLLIILVACFPKCLGIDFSMMILKDK